MDYLQMCLVVCPLVFLASFVDSIAGGGGLISLPAYMLTGLPMHVAYGCNKVSACLGSAVSTVTFYKSAKIHMKSAVSAAVFSLIGAFIGSKINLYIDGELLRKIIIVVLPIVAVVVLFGGKRKTREHMLEGSAMYIASSGIGLVIGLYDGLVGPGTGTFLILAFTSIVGLDYVTASGGAKVANLASNFSSVVLFVASGNVYYALVVPATICSLAGGVIGSRLAIKMGGRFIRVILVVVLIGILGKLAYDVFIGGA